VAQVLPLRVLDPPSSRGGVFCAFYREALKVKDRTLDTEGSGARKTFSGALGLQQLFEDSEERDRVGRDCARVRARGKLRKRSGA